VMVDTGSSGLRLLASAITLALPAVASPGGTYSECGDFADGIVWGGLALADLQLAGEKASSLPLQVIQDTGSGAPVPDSCSAEGANEDSLALLGANGILGVGLFIQDCGAYCTTTADAIYFDCTASGVCTEATIGLASQLTNPVALFAQDNNGVVLQLAAISDSGATAGTGNLIFGIGTQTNNVLSGTIIAVPSTGNTAGSFTATYNGVSLPNSFIDSGSSGFFFDDASIVQCPVTGVADGWYCPGSADALSEIPIAVTAAASNGATLSISGNVGNAAFLFASQSGSLNAFDDLAGPAGSSLPDAFDFGVPFFFGKSVFTALEEQATPGGTGPYFAYQAWP
jgi:hypothetical protein